MDVKAFGAFYTYGAPLPYASGVQAYPGSGYQSCRGVMAGSDGVIEAKFADGQENFISISGVKAGADMRLALTEIGPGTTSSNVIFLY